MPDLTIEWCWKLESPLHCGSGVAQAGFADRLIQRDEGGNPILPGDAVKGALRLSAEQIFAWLDHPQAYGDVAEPSHALLARLFGQSARARFDAARVQGNFETMRLPATRIDRRTGRALDNTLRTVEVLAPGAIFKSRCHLWPADEKEAALLRTLLLASLRATESIGGKAGVGWGRMRLESVKSTPGNKTELDLLMIEDLRDAIASAPRFAKADDTTSPIEASGDTNAPTQWWRLELELEEPLCLGARPDIANQQVTLDYIPATTLRGALRAAWKRDGAPETVVAFRLSDQTRWTNAHPAVGAASAATPCIPVPRSYACEKNARGVGGEHGVRDATWECGPSNEVAETGERLQWRPLRDEWMIAEIGTEGRPRLALYDQSGLRESRMHVARDYVTGSKRVGALFSRDAITSTGPDGEPRRFVSYVRMQGEPDWPALVYLGKRTSAGYGRVRLTASEDEQPWPASWRSEKTETPSRVIVQLLSDALIRDSSGAYQRSVDWRQALESPDLPLPVVARTALRPVQQWMSTWGHARSQATAIAAGSVWRFDFESEADATAFRSALRAKRDDGIGERCHEGFGWFAVDPPWLGHDRVEGDTPVTERKAERASAWPGCDGVRRDAIKEILRTTRETVSAVPPKELSRLRGPLQDLATRAREAVIGAKFASIREHCQSMASRGEAANTEDGERERKSTGKNAYAWRELRQGKPVRALLDSIWLEPGPDGPARLRFALEALLTLCSKERD